MNELVAGYISGLSQTLIGHPFDTVKVMIQNNNRVRFDSMTFKDYYKGVVYPLLFSCIVNASGFSIYNMCKTKYNLNDFVSGFLSGVGISPIIHIQDIGKINRQLNKANSVRSFLTTRGIVSTVLRESTAMSIYFGTYSYMRKNDHSVLLSGGTAGLMNWTLTYPFDIIRNRVYGQNITMYDAYKQGRLWNGYSFCAVRAVIVNSVGFYVYENSKEFLRNHKIVSDL